jgi:hypothetical protein
MPPKWNIIVLWAYFTLKSPVFSMAERHIYADENQF